MAFTVRFGSSGFGRSMGFRSFRAGGMRGGLPGLQPGVFKAGLQFNMHGIMTFDKNIIQSNWSKINRGPMQKAGNEVRMRARQSIKRRKGYNYYKRRVTRWGTPMLRGISPVGTPPRSRAPGQPMKRIYSVPFRPKNPAVIVGATKLNTPTPPVPSLHEHGGRARRQIFFGREPVRNPATGRYTHRISTYRTVMAKYPPRPFMYPALKKAKAELPQLWKGTFTSRSRPAA